MKKLIIANLRGTRVLFLFVLTNIIYVFMLAVTIPGVMRFSGGLKLLDMMPTGYSAAYVNSLFSTLGEDGRNAYLFNQLPVDMIYPFLFGISYCLLLGYFLKKVGKLETALFYFCYLPLFAGLFDYCENIGIITMLNRFPGDLSTPTQVTNIFSVLKSISTTIYFILLTIVLIIFGWHKLFKKRVSEK